MNKVLAILEKAGKKTVEAVEVVGSVAADIPKQIEAGVKLEGPVKTAIETTIADGEALGLAFAAAGGTAGTNVASDTAFLAAAVKFSTDFLESLPVLKSFVATIEADVKTDIADAKQAVAQGQ